MPAPTQKQAITAIGAISIAAGVGGLATATPILRVFGGLLVAVGLVQVVAAMVTYRRKRRLPASVRSPAPGIANLTLRDGSRVTAIAVLRGGYLRPRSTDPAFDARDVIAIEPSAPSDFVSERSRQQQLRGRNGSVEG
jgi:hypothetical protein